jgi:glycosyltransferase involved in cell wall biosynthesis
MARALALEGCRAEVVCTNDDGPGLLDAPLGRPVERGGASVRFFPRFSPRVSALREFQYSWPLGRWLREHMGDYDLVHVHAIFSYASTCAMALARREGVPYLVRPIGQLSGWSLGQKAAKKRAYLAVIERRNIGGARGVHCVSEAERRDVLGFDPALPAFVVPIGVDAPAAPADARAALRRRFGLAPDAFVILFLGRLHPKKGIETLLDAAARLRGRDFAVVVAGAGEPGYEARLQALARVPGLEGRVRLAGFAAGADKDLLLHGADLFALPSQHENFGIALLEALAAGLRVAVAPAVALSDFVRRAGAGRVVEDTPAALAEALDAEIAAGAAVEAERRRIREMAAAEFSWKSIAQRLVRVYEAVLAGRTPD